MDNVALSTAQRHDLKTGERVALILIRANLPGFFSIYGLAAEAGVAYNTAHRWVRGLESKDEIRMVNGRCYVLEG